MHTIKSEAGKPSRYFTREDTFRRFVRKHPLSYVALDDYRTSTRVFLQFTNGENTLLWLDPEKARKHVARWRSLWGTALYINSSEAGTVAPYNPVLVGSEKPVAISMSDTMYNFTEGNFSREELESVGYFFFGCMRCHALPAVEGMLPSEAVWGNEENPSHWIPDDEYYRGIYGHSWVPYERVDESRLPKVLEFMNILREADKKGKVGFKPFIGYGANQYGYLRQLPSNTLVYFRGCKLLAAEVA